MPKKLFVTILLMLACSLQYRLWLGKNSISEYRELQQQVDTLASQNSKLRQRNSLLEADIDDLQLGLDSMEERARNELGMIKEGETFYRILPQE